MTLNGAEQSYLAARPLGRLATIGPDGSPQNKPVGFSWNADLGTIDICGFGMEQSQKFRNVAGDPRGRLRGRRRHGDRRSRRTGPLRPPQDRRRPPHRRPAQPVRAPPRLPAPLPRHPPALRRSHRLPATCQRDTQRSCLTTKRIGCLHRIKEPRPASEPPLSCNNASRDSPSDLLNRHSATTTRSAVPPSRQATSAGRARAAEPTSAALGIDRLPLIPVARCCQSPR
jgi:Pyridoxamine 5'-phosphate oxidase